MRVIAGSARGRRLEAPPGTTTRPTTDRVREAVFNALGSLGAIVDSRVLDGFAGSGALGIEALSRGAARCTFVERDRSALAAVSANLERLGLEDRATVVAADLLVHLGRLDRTLPAGHDSPFDLVLLDPPHDSAVWPEILAALAPHLSPGATVVTESDHPVVGRDDAASWLVLREKRYGGTVVQVLSPRPSAPGQETPR